MDNQNQPLERPQDFELVDLLFRDKIAAQRVLPGASSTSTTPQISESFQARFQSFIDQIPSYMHSSNKPGFFTHFFLGSFSTLLDTQLNADKIHVKNLYYRFDGAKTLKVIAATEHKTHIFIFTEDSEEKHKSSTQTHNNKFEFTKDELDNINSARRKLKQSELNKKIEIKLVKIDDKSKIVSVVESKKIKDAGPAPTKFPFKEIGAQRNPGNYLEQDIEKLSGENEGEVNKSFRKILNHVKETHTALELSKDVYGSGAREADQHGFLAGVLDNFRYRYNTRIYLEQFAGRGYADIVLLVRGVARSTLSIPIIIELKAGTSAGTEPSNARQQAEGYALGFQPNTVRVLTFSNDVICVGLNLDYVPTTWVKEILKDINQIIDDENHIMGGALKEAIKDKLSEFTETNDPQLVKIIDDWQEGKAGLKEQITEYLQHPFSSSTVSWEPKDTHPCIIGMLQSAKEYFNEKIDNIALKERIENNLRRVYNTFPGTPEKGENHYFSKFLLGQSILIEDTDYKKHVFIYEKDSFIPTVEPGETKTVGRPAKIAATEKIKQDAKVSYDTSHAITTILFVPDSKIEPVYLVNIIESNRDLSLSKKIKLPENLMGNRKIYRLNLQLRVDNKGKSFDSFCKLASMEKYDSLQHYNNQNVNLEKFNGKFENIPYLAGLKERFDEAFNAQKKTEPSEELLENYKKLFEQTLGETINPFKSLIEKEAHFQGVLQGVWSHYSDLKLSESPATRAVVLTEFQTGRGNRIDMLIHGIGPLLDPKKYQPIGLEIKGPRKGVTDKKLMQEAKGQLNDYKTVVYKTLTDGDTVYLLPVVFSPADKNGLIQLGTELFPVPVVHSSIQLLPKPIAARAEDLGRVGEQSKHASNVNLRDCLNGGRKKRSTNGCLFSKDDVNEFIQEDNQYNSEDKAAIDLDKIILDSEKFIDYLKTDISDEKRAQLIELASKVKVVGDVNSRNIWLKSQETQQEVSMKLSNFLADKFPHAKITPIAQSLYLSEFKKGAIRTNNMSAGINWVLLKLPTNERALFLKNLKILKLLHNRLLQGQPISKREYKEYFAFSQVLSNFSKIFEEKLIIQNNKNLVDLQNTINELKGDFTIYLEVSGNRVVIQRRDNFYSYLDSSIGHIEGLRELSDKGQETQKVEVLEVFEKANILSGHLMQPRLTTEYELVEDKFSIELIDQEEVNQVLSATEKQKLISLIETERHRLSLQDKQLGRLQFEGREISRTELYDLGTKLLSAGNIKESSEWITENMSLSNEMLKEYLTTKRISVNADSYLTALVQHSESERIILAQTLKTIPFEGSDHAIQRSQEIQKLLTSTEDSQLKKYHLKKLLYQPTELDMQSMSYNDPKVGITKHWPNRLTNAAGRISMLHGGYSTIQALRYGDTTGFALGAGEMSFSLFSQLLEDGVVKVTPQIIKQMKYGMHFSRGFAGLISSPFDAYDLIRSSIDASEATKGSKVWRDNIASATFAGASIASSVVFTAISMPGAGIVVGFGIIVGQGIYSGASMIVEYKKYHLTTDQEFRLFWHTFVLQPLPKDVQYIQARQEILDELAKNAWEQLKNKPEIVAYAMGLGNITLQEAPTRSKRGIFDVFSSIKEKVSDFGNYIKTGISNLGNIIQQKARDLGNNIKTQAVKFSNIIEKEVNNFSKILEKKIENFGNNVRKKASDFGNYIKSLGDSAQKKISIVENNIKTKAIHLMDGIEKKISKFSNNVEQKASNLGNAIKSKVNNLSNNARSGINNFVDAVKSEANDLNNNIKEKASDVVDYVREVFEIKNPVPILSPDKSIINLQNSQSKNLARILPKMPDQNAVWICLPQFTGKDYEYDYTLGKKSPIYGNSETAHYICDNAMVIADQQRMTRKDSSASIVYDGSLIRSGNVFGHPQYNGKFIIGSGTAEFQGISNKINSFLVTDETFSGGVIGGRDHAVNLLDVSFLESAAVDYTVTAESGKVIIGNNLALRTPSGFTTENINRFVGRIGKQEVVNCKNNLELVLDTQGGSSSSQPDKIELENCKQVIVSANTEVTGRSNQPNFYIRPGIGIYKINVVTNQGKLIFSDTVLDQLHNIIYSPKENVLSIDINLNQGANAVQHASHSVRKVVNYLNTARNMANFELIDKNGHIIDPMIPSDDESEPVTITSFSLKAEIDFRTKNPVTWYENISKTWQGYSVYTVVKDKDSANSYRIFGSSQSDVITLGKEVPWVQGGNSSDVYTFTNYTENSPTVNINNFAQDQLWDILYIPTNNEIAASKQNQDLFLRTNLDDIQASTYATYIQNYFSGAKYQHLIIVDSDQKSWIPFSENNQDVSILPFYRATTQRSIFTITVEKIKENPRIVLDIGSEQLRFYRNNNDLYLIALSSNASNLPLRIQLEQFYTNENLMHKNWQSFSVYCQQDSRMLTNQILIQFAQLAIDYINLENRDRDIIQTYVVDLSSTQKIYHNQVFNNGTWSVVSTDKERLGVLDFVNQSPSSLKVSVSNKDLEFSNDNQDSKLTVVNWDNPQNRISVFKFNNICVTGLEGFNISQVSEIQGLVSKAVLSHVADQQLEQCGQDVVDGLKYLLSVDGIEHSKTTYHCLGFNSADEQGHFVAIYHNDFQGKQGAGNIINNLHAADGFMWLMVKAMSELSLKGHGKESLSNELSQCFSSISDNKEIISKLIQQLDSYDIRNGTSDIEGLVHNYHTKLDDVIHHLSSHQQHQSTLNASLSENQVGSSNRSKRSIDIIETNINTHYDNVSSGSSRLQFWPVNLIKKSGGAVLSFLSIIQILPQLELLVKQQLAQMLSNDPGIKLDNKQQKEELVKRGPIHTEIKKDNTIDADLDVPKSKSKFRSNQYESRFEFSKDRQYIVWRDQDNQAYNMAYLTSGFVFESDNKFQLQKHYVGCGRVPEYTKLPRRNATDHSAKNKNIHIIKTHQENLLCLNFHSVETFDSEDRLPSWVLTCKKPLLLELSIPTPRLPSYLDTTEQNVGLILRGMNIHNMIDNWVKTILPFLNIPQRSIVTVPVEVLAVLGASYVTAPTNIGFVQHIPSAKHYFDLAKHYLVQSNIIRNSIPEKYKIRTKTIENIVAGSLMLAAIGVASYSSVLSFSFATYSIYNGVRPVLGGCSSLLVTAFLVGTTSYWDIGAKVSHALPRIIQGMHILQIASSLCSINNLIFAVAKNGKTAKDKEVVVEDIRELVSGLESLELIESDKVEVDKIVITLDDADRCSIEELLDGYNKLDEIDSKYYFDASDGISEEDNASTTQNLHSVNVDNIISAIKNNDLTRVKSYIEENKNVNACSKGGRPLIIVAVENNCSIELVELLIDNGSDVNLADPDGESAINLAAYKGSFELIKLLISRGAKIKGKTEKNSPFSSIAESCLPQRTQDQVIKLLTEWQYKTSNATNLTRILVQQVPAMHSSIVYNTLTSRSVSNPDPVYSNRVSGLFPMSSQ